MITRLQRRSGWNSKCTKKIFTGFLFSLNTKPRSGDYIFRNFGWFTPDWFFNRAYPTSFISFQYTELKPSQHFSPLLLTIFLIFAGMWVIDTGKSERLQDTATAHLLMWVPHTFSRYWRLFSCAVGITISVMSTQFSDSLPTETILWIFGVTHPRGRFV
jgi:hypothetical protein